MILLGRHGGQVNGSRFALCVPLSQQRKFIAISSSEQIQLICKEDYHPLFPTRIAELSIFLIINGGSRDGVFLSLTAKRSRKLVSFRPLILLMPLPVPSANHSCFTYPLHYPAPSCRSIAYIIPDTIDSFLSSCLDSICLDSSLNPTD